MLPILMTTTLPAFVAAAREMRRKAVGPLDICQSTDPRDRVYALLPIVRRAGGVIPDYAKSTIDVYKETSSAFLRLCDMSVLELADGWSKSKLNDLPSWAVDWSNDDLTANVNPFLSKIEAIGAEISFGHPNIRNETKSDQNEFLYIRGVLVGHVIAVIQAGLEMSTVLFSSEDYQNTSSYHRGCLLRRLTRALRSTLPGLSQWQAVSRIAHAGHAMNEDEELDIEALTYQVQTEIMGTSKLRRAMQRVYRQRKPDLRTVLKDHVLRMLVRDLIVFNNGLCAFHQVRPRKVEIGDQLVAFWGSGLPFIVRGQSTNATSLLMGPLPVAGIDEDHLLRDVTLQKTFVLA